MRTIRLPEPLNPGDLIQIVSPAGPVDEARLNIGITRLKSWGFQVNVAPHALSKKDYLAGFDKDRSKDLHKAFTDPEIKAVICSR